MLSVYEVRNLNGEEEKEFICFRTSDLLLLFKEEDYCYDVYALYLYVLGFILEDVTKLLNIQVDTIDVKDGGLESAIGKLLAYPIMKKWVEDFVNEDNGEVYSIDRYMPIIEAGTYVSEENIGDIRECGVERIHVLHDSVGAEYVHFIKHIIEQEEYDKDSSSDLNEQEIEAVNKTFLQDHNLFKSAEEITNENKEKLAYNIVTVIKAMIDSSSCLSDKILPFRFKEDEVHQEMTQEEQQLQLLIKDFYNEMIQSVSECKSDMDAIKVFKDKGEIQSELRSYLENHCIYTDRINMFLNNIFEYIR
jgi:hypothetical protein